MAEKIHRRNLGRGLSALIPDVDMEFLSRVIRDKPVVATPIKPDAGTSSPDTFHIDEAKSVEKKRKLLPLPPVSPVVVNSESVNDAISLNSPIILEENSKDSDEKNPSPAIYKDLTDTIEFVYTADIEANPYQPRRFFSPAELEELADSLREHGVLQPVILRPYAIDNSLDSSRHYQLIAGERRWRAAQIAGLSQIPAIIRPVSDQQALELALIENVQRHDISALDAAIAYRRLSQEFSLSHEQVAKRVGKSRSAVANTIRLLDLPIEAQRAIEEGSLSEGHGRAILLASSDGARRAVFRRVVRDKLSVRNTEDLARQTKDIVSEKSSDDDTPIEKTRLSPEVRRIEEKLQKHLGTRVNLKLRRQGGQISIHYFSNEELERLLRLLMQ